VSRKKILRSISSIQKELSNQYNDLVSIKTKKEIKYIKKACAITVKIYSKILKNDLRIGVSEKYIADKIYKYSQKLGADKDLAFSSIVGSGPNSSYIHSEPTKRKIKKGDVVQFDFGVKYKGYCSDFSRVVCVGNKQNIPKKIQKYFKLVKEAQSLALKKLKKHKSFKKIDQSVKDLFKKNNVDYNYFHSLGHGLGTYIHEYPRVSFDANPKLKPKPGMVITIEPGLYFPGKYGFRIEDTVVITKNGYDNLTNGSKGLFF